jgi:hypothetical protein
MMNQKYYGSVCCDDGGIVFEDNYESKSLALRDLRKKAKKAARNSYDEQPVSVTLFCGENVVAFGKVSTERTLFPDYGMRGLNSATMGGTKIC